MKKTTRQNRALKLARETIKELAPSTLQTVVGGVVNYMDETRKTPYC